MRHYILALTLLVSLTSFAQDASDQDQANAPGVNQTADQPDDQPAAPAPVQSVNLPKHAAAPAAPRAPLQVGEAGPDSPFHRPPPDNKNIPIIRPAGQPIVLKITRYYPVTWGNNLAAVAESNTFPRIGFDMTKNEVIILSLPGATLNTYNADHKVLQSTLLMFSRASERCPIMVTIDRNDLTIKSIKPSSTKDRACDELN